MAGHYQKTLRQMAELKGVGVHGGKPAMVRLYPAPLDHGVVFHRSDESGRVHQLAAHVSMLGATDLCTALGPVEARVNTIEHLMAAIVASQLDNVRIEVDSAEIPIMDGGSVSFLEAITAAGIENQQNPRRYLRILKTIGVGSAEQWGEFSPYDGTRYEVEIDFPTPAIGRQHFAIDLTVDTFFKQVAQARTFGFMRDVERLRAMGLALGSSLENSIAIADDDTIVNEGGLFFPDEFVRHKTLDAIGDLALLGYPFIGRFRSYRGGHRLNSELVKALLADQDAYEIVEAAAGFE